MLTEGQSRIAYIVYRIAQYASRTTQYEIHISHFYSITKLTLVNRLSQDNFRC